jgi:hypothetical protein
MLKIKYLKSSLNDFNSDPFFIVYSDLEII